MQRLRHNEDDPAEVLSVFEALGAGVATERPRGARGRGDCLVETFLTLLAQGYAHAWSEGGSRGSWAVIPSGAARVPAILA
jgi:hypothetical protein